MHEVDPLDQLGEAVRLQDHRDQIRLALLVAGHQVLRQGLGRPLELVLEIDQVVPRREQLPLHGSELGLSRGESVLEYGQALVGLCETLTGLADLGGIGGDLRAERGGRRLAGRDLALEVACAAARQPRSEQDGGHDEERDDPGDSDTFVGERHADAYGHGEAGARARRIGHRGLGQSPLDGSPRNLARRTATAVPDPAYATNPASAGGYLNADA